MSFPGFEAAKAVLVVGETYKDGAYVLDSVDETKRRFLFTRTKTGKPVNVSCRLLERVWAATEGGGTLARRENGPTGISYTVAIEFLVCAALGLTLDDDGRWERAS